MFKRILIAATMLGFLSGIGAQDAREAHHEAFADKSQVAIRAPFRPRGRSAEHGHMTG